jgi:hypothetical protein
MFQSGTEGYKSTKPEIKEEYLKFPCMQNDIIAMKTCGELIWL